MSKYLDRKFKHDFSETCEMWTGEDGMLMSLTIARSENAESLLRQHSAFQQETFDAQRMKPRFVCRDYKMDEEEWSDCRVLWRVCDTPTDYPIFEYELEFSR